MLPKRVRIIIMILLFCLLGIVCSMGYRIYRIDQELIQEKNRTETLEFQLGVKNKTLETAQTDLKTITKERDDLQISYEADEIFIKKIESRYTKLYSYAQVAEAILTANGIEFRIVEGGLDLESLRGEDQ